MQYTCTKQYHWYHGSMWCPETRGRHEGPALRGDEVALGYYSPSLPAAEASVGIPGVVCLPYTCTYVLARECSSTYWYCNTYVPRYYGTSVVVQWYDNYTCTYSSSSGGRVVLTTPVRAVQADQATPI
jgi:hypothetical protein